ncbi:MAG: AAA family ATPase [Patescibacteria group bacterium]
MKRLSLFVGLPGSGKSTLAHALAGRLGAEIVDIDDFKRDVVDPTALSEGIDPPDVRWQYYRRALDHILGLFENGAEHVVTDEMFHVRELRERIEAVCVQCGISVLWIEVRCTDAEVVSHLAVHPRKGHILSTEQTLRMRQEVARVFDDFPCNANRLVVSNAGSVDDAVNMAHEWVCTR